MAFVLSFFVPHCSFFWFLWKAVLRFCGIFLGILTHIFTRIKITKKFDGLTLRSALAVVPLQTWAVRYCRGYVLSDSGIFISTFEWLMTYLNPIVMPVHVSVCDWFAKVTV